MTTLTHPSEADPGPPLRTLDVIGEPRRHWTAVDLAHEDAAHRDVRTSLRPGRADAA